MTQRTRNTVVTAIVLVGVGALLSVNWSRRDRFNPPETGGQAPEFVATTLTGEDVSLDAFRGQVVLLNIWATWCGPCIWEMPALERLHQEMAGDGLAVVAVSVDRAAGSLGGGDVQAFVREHDLTFTVLHDPSGKIERQYEVAGLPTTYLIDRQGRVREKVLGPAKWDEPPYAPRIRRLLEE